MCPILSRHVRQPISPKRICLMYYPITWTLKKAYVHSIYLPVQAVSASSLFHVGVTSVISVEKDRDHYAFICKIMKELQDRQMPAYPRRCI